jgi:hypothetical protein
MQPRLIALTAACWLAAIGTSLAQARPCVDNGADHDRKVFKSRPAPSPIPTVAPIKVADALAILWVCAVIGYGGRNRHVYAELAGESTSQGGAIDEITARHPFSDLGDRFDRIWYVRPACISRRRPRLSCNRPRVFGEAETRQAPELMGGDS